MRRPRLEAFDNFYGQYGTSENKGGKGCAQLTPEVVPLSSHVRLAYPKGDTKINALAMVI